jgi:exonuclease VII small subunit
LALFLQELEAVKKELRTVVQTLKTNEMRLNRSLEELEKLRTIMHNHERDDKELRDLTRKKEDEVAVVVKRLEKHKSELLLAFKKQMQLIDNLKKQKVSNMFVTAE